MRFVEFRTVKIDRIDVGARLRPVDQDYATALAELIGASELQHPIRVWQPKAKGRYLLTAGAHRLAACKQLGWSEIQTALVEPETDDPKAEARFDEAVENLGRHELNALDRAATLVAFKNDYEWLHPVAKRGQFGGRGGKKNETDIMSVSKIVAEKTGLTDRSIRRIVAFYDALDSKVRDRLAGTWMASDQSQLVALSKLDHERQAQVVDILLDDANEVARVNEASGLIDDPKPAKVDAADKMFKRLLSLYESAPKKVQTRFLKHLSDQSAKPAKRANGTTRQLDIEDAIDAQGGSA